MVDLSKYRIHDLTHTYSEQIAGYSESTARTIQEDGWNAKWLRIYSHAGTHMDAPIHFNVNKQTIDEYLPSQLMGSAWLVHVEITEAQQLIELDDLGDLIERFEPFDSLLIRSNWSKKIDEPEVYRNHMPRISKQLAEWCVENKVKILGVEAGSVADVNNLAEVTEIHGILLGGNVIIVEGLKNLDLIERDKVFLVALPIKTLAGDGAPARVIAFEEKNEV